MSSKVSSTFQNACIAAQGFPRGRIRIVDTQQLSASYTLLAVTAARMLEEGKTLEETACHIEEVRSFVKMYVFPDTLKYLHKGGRVSGVQQFVGNILKIRPIISIEKGNVVTAGKYRGKMEKFLETLLKSIVNNNEIIQPGLVVIAHSLAKRTADYIRSNLNQHLVSQELVIIEGGCTIVSHTGPGTVAFSYLMKETLPS